MSRLHAPALVALLVLCTARALAGECIDGDEAHYVRAFEAEVEGRVKTPALGEAESAYYCLTRHYTRVGGMTNRWAGPRAARLIRARKTSPHRTRIARACATLLRRHPARLHAGCVLLAASYGIETVGGESIWALQARLLPEGFPPEQLAVLGGPRAVAQLVAAFGREQSCTRSWDEAVRSARVRCTPFPDGWKRNRWRRKAFEESKISILNALWHVRLPESRAFLTRVAREDESPTVRERAARVLEHLDGKRSASD